MCLATYGKRKITGGISKWELIRFCNKLHTTVIGGFSKLQKHFENNFLKPNEQIISYANLRYSNGNMYEKNGFKFLHSSSPSYWYIFNGELMHRSLFQKHKLPNILKENFDSNLTEWQNMKNNGYDRIWDCGTLVFNKYFK